MWVIPSHKGIYAMTTRAHLKLAERMSFKDNNTCV